MDFICSRCQINKSRKMSAFIADEHFDFRFSDIKKIDSRREYLLCERCLTILKNYTNPATVLSRIVIWVFWTIGLSLFVTSIFLTVFYEHMYLFNGACAIWVFINTLVLPISPLVRKKYIRTKWKLGDLIFENRDFTVDEYEAASNEKKQEIRLKEFDVIYSADEICTEIAEEKMSI